ncbi:type II secretion system protein [Knoellia subterranea KCTC 19937]|uniref:Type II secretion system protein n=2 Tax=Knoellia TaxID=136099 RepID=A0A0A0JMZ0_9MICO|nr:type II secretion system protein [Knoellia subterranea KCTC 19937]
MRSGLGPVEALEAVAGQAPPEVAHQLRVVASAHRWGQESATAWAHVGEGWRPAALAWEAAERSGAAPAGVVLAAAERMRREESARVEAAVQRAGVLLVLPLGACFLPGFVGTTVVPVVLHLARATLSGG